MAGKGGLAIMIGLGKKKPGAGMDMGGMDSEDESAGMDEQAEDDAIQSMMDAMKDKDVASFKDGLKTFLELCYPSLSHHKSDYSEGSGDEEP